MMLAVRCVCVCVFVSLRFPSIFFSSITLHHLLLYIYIFAWWSLRLQPDPSNESTYLLPRRPSSTAHVSIKAMPPRIRTVEGSCWGCKERRVICDLNVPSCDKYRTLLLLLPLSSPSPFPSSSCPIFLQPLFQFESANLPLPFSC